jgi:hypothetical protein
MKGDGVARRRLVIVVPDKWVWPTRRPTDLSVGLPNMTCGPEDQTSVVSPDSPKITGLCCNLLEIGFPIVTDLDSRSTDLVCQPI